MINVQTNQLLLDNDGNGDLLNEGLVLHKIVQDTDISIVGQHA